MSRSFLVEHLKKVMLLSLSLSSMLILSLCSWLSVDQARKGQWKLDAVLGRRVYDIEICTDAINVTVTVRMQPKKSLGRSDLCQNHALTRILCCLALRLFD